jgi:hypothetical protein
VIGAFALPLAAKQRLFKVETSPVFERQALERSSRALQYHLFIFFSLLIHSNRQNTLNVKKAMSHSGAVLLALGIVFNVVAESLFATLVFSSF